MPSSWTRPWLGRTHDFTDESAGSAHTALPASWPSAALQFHLVQTYRKTAGEESRRRSPVANRWMRP